MKFELNFLPDVPTVNGRIYTKEALEKIYDKMKPYIIKFFKGWKFSNKKVNDIKNTQYVYIKE